MFEVGDRVIYKGDDPVVVPGAAEAGDRGTVMGQVLGLKSMVAWEVEFDHLMPDGESKVNQWVDENFLVKSES